MALLRKPEKQLKSLINVYVNWWQPEKCREQPDKALGAHRFSNKKKDAEIISKHVAQRLHPGYCDFRDDRRCRLYDCQSFATGRGYL